MCENMGVKQRLAQKALPTLVASVAELLAMLCESMPKKALSAAKCEPTLLTLKFTLKFCNNRRFYTVIIYLYQKLLVIKVWGTSAALCSLYPELKNKDYETDFYLIDFNFHAELIHYHAFDVSFDVSFTVLT